MKRYHEVDTQQTIIDVANRLQPYIRTRWKKKAFEIKRSKDEYPSYHDLVLFVQEFAEDANDPVYGQFNTRGALSDSRSHVKEKSIQSTNFMASTKMSVPAKKTLCTLCKAEHRLIFCPEFKCMDVQKRKKFVCDNRLCEICLHYGHFKKSCRSPYVCTVQGCNKKHSSLIHVSSANHDVNVSNANSLNEQVNVDSMSVNVKSGLGVYMPTVQVKVNGQCYVNALLDTGSSNSFCTQSIVDVLSVGGSRVSYQLSTLGQSKKSKESQCVALKLESTDGQETLNMSRVFVVDEIPINNPVLDISNCDHLKDIPVTRAGKIEILIGLDVRKGAKGKPFAVRTMFGWSINGPNTETKVSQSVISNFVTSRNIENDVDKLWKIENEPLRETQPWSSEDKRVIDLWDN